MDLELNGKRALISGGYRGTGAGLARVLAREGPTVWIHGFEIDAAEAIAQSIRKEGHDAHAVAADIRTDDDGRDVATPKRGICLIRSVGCQKTIYRTC